MSESIVWSIITQEVMVTKMKNQMSDRKLASRKMASIQEQIRTHGL
jgi:hypothetical protein